MATAEQDMAALENQLEKALKLAENLNKSTEAIIEKGEQRKIIRQMKNLTEKTEKIHEIKELLRDAKFTADEDEEETEQAIKEIDERAEVFENAIDELDFKLAKIQAEAKRKAREEEMALERAYEQEKMDREYRQREKEEKERLRRQAEHEDEQLEKRLKKMEQQQVQVKLPKLVISKFNGTYLDWLRFWEQFRSQIDESAIADGAKLTYLQELLEEKPKQEILGLPFSSEGYQQAKEILERKYGIDSEIINAHVTQIFSLPVVMRHDVIKIHDFYQKLNLSVQSLKTLKKLSTVEGLVRMTLDKLECIKSDLIRTDDNWRSWDFPELVEALREWTFRSPIKTTEEASKLKLGEDRKPSRFRKERGFQTQTKKSRSCVYCEKDDHRSSDCTKLKSIEERKSHLVKNKLCYNCTGNRHTAAKCKSSVSCQVCNGRHHTSICEKRKENLLAATMAGQVIHPMVLVDVDGIRCRAILDTAASTSYASSSLVNALKKKMLRKEAREIEMMLGTKKTVFEVYAAELKAVDGDFSMTTEITKLDKPVVTKVPNPDFVGVLRKYAHLKGVNIADMSQKEQLPIHLILGAGDYNAAKLEEPQRVGKPGEPTAEKTRFGWTLMAPGKGEDSGKLYFAQTTAQEDLKSLYSLDVLGLTDTKEGDQQDVYAEFKEQLMRKPEGYYETRLPWKQNHPDLPTNEQVSLQRLNANLTKLDRRDLLQQYDDVMKQQLADGILEPAPEEPTGDVVHYIPHKAVIREQAESTKLRIVYDASARASTESPSLNDCLEVGPPLQPLLFDVILRNRMKPIALTGDLKQAFLQIRIAEQDRDAMRLHWLSDLETRKIAQYRFTRAIFGGGPSPFLLGATIAEHLKQYEEKQFEVVQEIRDSLYVDDIISGGDEISNLHDMKSQMINIFKDGGFQLHKWHSNAAELEDCMSSNEAQTYADESLGARNTETSILGLKWNKKQDLISVNFLPAKETAETTKRGILRGMARIYDPLGIAAPVLLKAKTLYRQACEDNLPWDKQLPESLAKQWIKWQRQLPESISVPRCVSMKAVKDIKLHGFGDASKDGCCVTIYVVASDGVETTQGLLTSKVRVAKKNLTIPRLELISGHMVANMLDNTRNILKRYPVTSCHGWLDSTVALYWIQDLNQYKQFVANRVRKIREKKDISWRHVPTDENPSDQGSRGTIADKLEDLWFKGPEWLKNPSEWPENIVLKPSKESREEAKLIKEVLMKTMEKPKEDALWTLMEKFSYWKAIRVTAWANRFLLNCKQAKRHIGPLSTNEIELAKNHWVKKVQTDAQTAVGFEQQKEKLNLTEDERGILRCYGRIEGDYPIYLPDSDPFTRKLIMHEHMQTLHGGVNSTMARIRNQWWIPKLRRLVKSIIHGCPGCKKYRAIPLQAPAQANLPEFRTTPGKPFQVTGVDFAGPILYRRKKKMQSKCYVVLYTCTTTRAVSLQLLPDLTAEEFQHSLKLFIAKRGTPERLVSDNGKTFVATGKWIKKLKKNPNLTNYLGKSQIVWQFNLSRAAWWGGFFERLIGIMKRTLNRTIGKSLLKFKELEDVLVDIEISMNNRPLTYQGEEFDSQPLTPNMLIFGGNIRTPEIDLDVEDERLAYIKREKYLQKCKDQMWNRWTSEYVKALRERHTQKKNVNSTVKDGDVVIIKGDEKNRGFWKLGIVTSLIKGKDGVVRGVKLRAGKGIMERPLQHVYPLELKTETWKLNPKAKEFQPNSEVKKQARGAKETAKALIQHFADENDDEQ